MILLSYITRLGDDMKWFKFEDEMPKDNILIMILVGAYGFGDIFAFINQRHISEGLWFYDKLGYVKNGEFFVLSSDPKDSGTLVEKCMIPYPAYTLGWRDRIDDECETQYGRFHDQEWINYFIAKIYKEAENNNPEFYKNLISLRDNPDESIKQRSKAIFEEIEKMDKEFGKYLNKDNES